MKLPGDEVAKPESVMNYSARRMYAVLCGAALTLGIVVSTPASSADLPAKNFTRIAWLSSCDGHESVTYFYLDLLPGGVLRYEGVTDVKTLGSKEEQLDSKAARQLRSAVGDFLAGKVRTGKDDGGASFCVRVQAYKLGRVADSQSELIRANQPPSVLQKIDELASQKKWACPARLSSTKSGSRSARYCDERAAFVMTVAGKNACDLTRHVEVYLEGEIYIATYGPQLRQLLDHSYYHIGSESVTDLVETINAFEASPRGRIEQWPESAQQLYVRDRSADIEDIKARLTKLADVEWTHFEGADHCDESMGRPHSEISLRSDLDRAAISKDR